MIITKMIFTMVIGKTIDDMEREFDGGPMVKNTVVNGQTEKSMAKVPLNSRMVVTTRVIGRWEFGKEKG